MTKDYAFKKVSELVNRFEEQYDSYKSTVYKEKQTRTDFIDPFFNALGWNIGNEQGYAEAYREVIQEFKQEMGGRTQLPDYSFRLSGGKTLFFVEAKKPHVYIKEEVTAAYQVRLYAWNAQLKISIVTDFEEFAIYDCTKKPNINDKASFSRIRYLTFREYLSEFDFLWDTFSKERVLKGAFDIFIQSDKDKRGTATVDQEFLSSLDNWRKYLASSISMNNLKLKEDEINFVVQQTINRIIFLRIAEDRNVEAYGELKHAIEHGDFYKNLFHLFEKADEKYNSGLFDFRKDQISKRVEIDNKVIKNIIEDLYFPKCHYLFNILSVEILGNAYEQFLGKQIKINKAHHASIEEKPEVRKAGGVYYTPQYIVEYIVRNTIGKMMHIADSPSPHRARPGRSEGRGQGEVSLGQTPQQISRLRILDPACGSGSFLLGAYQYLLDYHKNYYSNHGKPSKGKKDHPLTPEGNLTTAEKKRILTNNIFGVDIDANAVEVTKLSLLLKCMEGETQASINQTINLWHDRVLPTLDDNIKCGNSLIGTDYYDGMFDFGEDNEVKPFDWKKEFKEIFAPSPRGEGWGGVEGFDIVIGNPPYVRQEMLGKQKEYFQKVYKVYHGMADLYTYFFERGISLLKPDGIFGIIVANKWMRANYGEPLRKWLRQQDIEQLIDFGDLPVFKATTYPMIFIAGKEKKKSRTTFFATNVKTLEFKSIEEYVRTHHKPIERSSLDDSGWQLEGEAEHKLLRKLMSTGIPLGEYVQGKIFRGIVTGFNDAFVIDAVTKRKLIREDKRSAEVIKPFLAGRDVKRYQPLYSDTYLIFTRRGININNYPAIKNYLLQFKSLLTPKPKNWQGGEWKGRKPGPYKWYEIQDSIDYFNEFEKPKIIFPNICKQPEFTFDQKKWFTNQKCFIISLDDKYLLGILNSKLNFFLFDHLLPRLRGGFYEPSYVFFKTFPIKTIDPKNKKEKSLHDEIVKNVDQLLKLNKQLNESKLPSKQDQLNSRIAHHDSRINECVYELYALTREERGMVEGR